ncbi:hypothetical protein, variant [Aphanomyces invadans]|nr:hypothetical protein, variant [Aphanomyces invadans]ETW02888.1 hypothetical protein, variant [Aphanomyces invadans]|eukprot:XP_008868272.1 hypothetical protein, variant [Aphanomyces invadans]
MTHSPQQIVLMERVRLFSRLPNHLAIEYIKHCIAAGQLLDREPFMLTADWEETPPSQLRRPSSHSGRKQYTNVERGAMLSFARSHKRDINQKLPRAFWERAAKDKVTSHSAESMHEHYRKQLLHKTPAEKDALINTYLAHLVATNRPRDEPKSPPRAKLRAPLPLFNLPPTQDAPLLPEIFASAELATSNHSITAEAVEVTRTSSAKSEHVDPPEEAASPDAKPPANEALPTTPVQGVPCVTGAVQPIQRDPPSSSTSAEILAFEPAVATPPRIHAPPPRHTSSRQLASDEDVDRMTERLVMMTGMPRPVVTHALYCCSGNPRVAFKYLRGQLPLDCWTEEEDEWIRSQFGVLPKTWSPDLVKGTIRQVIHTHGGTTRPHTVQMVWQRLDFLTND